MPKHARSVDRSTQISQDYLLLFVCEFLRERRGRGPVSGEGRFQCKQLALLRGDDLTRVLKRALEGLALGQAGQLLARGQLRLLMEEGRRG